MTLLQIDPGGEKYLSFAKKKLRQWHEEMLSTGVASVARTILVDDGTTIYINSLLVGDGVFKDRIRITGADQFYWEEGYPEQDLWAISSAVLPQDRPGGGLPIQHITYQYLTSDANIHETKHQWVIARYCKRVAGFDVTESWAYGTNLIVPGSYVSHTENLVSSSDGLKYVGEYVPGSGIEDPEVSGRIVPLMIKRTNTVYTVSAPGGELVGVMGEFVSFDLASNIFRMRVLVSLPKNIVHLGEVQTQDETNVTVWDYLDNGTRVQRVLSHGLRAAELANPWGLVDPDPMPNGADYTTGFTLYGPPGRNPQWGGPGPALFQGVTWNTPSGSGSATTPIFYLIVANQWGEIDPTPPLSIYESDATTDYYQGGTEVSSNFNPYAYSQAPVIYAADLAAWRSRQFLRAKAIWDFIQSEMDRKRFCPTADLNELRPHPTKQFNKLLVFPVRSSALLNVWQTGVGGTPPGTGPVESYQWRSSYFPWSGLTYRQVSLQAPTDAGPVPKWTYTMDQPCQFNWNATTRAFTLSTTPPTYRKFYFSFGTTEMKGYSQRSYFGLYHVKGKAPTTGLYEYSQVTNDTQMGIACLNAGPLAYPAYSALFAPLRGAYWRRLLHTITSVPYSVTQPQISNADADLLTPP